MRNEELTTLLNERMKEIARDVFQEFAPEYLAPPSEADTEAAKLRGQLARTVLTGLPTWQNRERWLNKFAPDEEERLFAAFNEYGEHLAAISRLVLNTGIRPKEILALKKEHVNLSDNARYYKVQKIDALIPPGSVLIAKGKDGKPRVLPLNRVARNVFRILIGDTTTGEWLFTNRDGKPMKSVKQGFAAACARAKIEDLRLYDLRHTFAARLLDRGVHQYLISALLGHAMPLTGFGHASRITPGYAHATWEAMTVAVESLEQPLSTPQQPLGEKSGKSLANQMDERKVG